MTEAGDVGHRYQCPATRPENGWTEYPDEAARAIGRLNCDRKKLPEQQGLMVLKLPRSKNTSDGSFRWHVGPPDHTRTDLKWYTDESCCNPTSPEIATTGYAVVVTDRAGNLVAYGSGVPPAWVDDSGKAEVWAIAEVVASTVTLPRIITDYKAALSTANAGTAAATSSHKVNARAWAVAAHRLDGDITKLASVGALDWMPAHLSHSTARCRVMAYGREVPTVDWRANRLVDALAQRDQHSSKAAERLPSMHWRA